MKVKIGNKMYDSEKEPIMLILADIDKANIQHMDPEHFIYCAHPEDMKTEDVVEWMKKK